MRDVCWNGSPYQPVPVATDVSKDVALRVLEQPEDYPGVLAEQQSVRSYPRPFGINLAHVLGYLSPITEDEFDAAERDDRSLNGASVVGRAGVEKQYDEWLRGLPGYRRVAVDSMGRVLGDDSLVESTPGDTLVTSIDAKVQSRRGEAARRADQVQRATSTRSPAASTWPTRAPRWCSTRGPAGSSRWPASRRTTPTCGPAASAVASSRTSTPRRPARPLLSRATQGQFAPGSTWKPFMTAGALTNGYSTDTTLPCSVGLPGRQPGLQELRVRRLRQHRLRQGPRGLVQHLLLPRSATTSGSASAATRPTSTPRTRWSRRPRSSASARAPASTCPARRRAGSPTGTGSRTTTSRRRTTTAGSPTSRRPPKTSDFVYKFAREFCIEGNLYRAGDAVNFSIGQGDTIVTPLQLARAYAALSNGGTLYAPTVAKAIVSPEGEVLRRIAPRKVGRVDVPKKYLDYIDAALQDVTRVGTMAWKLVGFPLDDVTIRAKTGSAEVYGKQSTGWVASYTEDYVVVMMISQGGTGSGSTGEGIRAIWESLYGIEGETVRPARAATPGTVPPARLPQFLAGRLDHAAGPREGDEVCREDRADRRPRRAGPACARPGSTGC